MMDKLRYSRPARLWREALPVGNSYTGVMIYGGKRTEKLCFNDSSLWSGYPKNHTNPESLKNLDKVRSLVFEGKNAEADKLCMEKLCGKYSDGYLPLGDLILSFSAQRYKNYNRELDIGNAIHKVTFSSVKREAFCSYPDRIFVYRIESETPFSLSVSAKCKLHNEIFTDDGLNIVGNAPDYVAPNYLRNEIHPVRYDRNKGMSFCLRCEAECDGTLEIKNTRINIADAHCVTLYVTTSTGFMGCDRMPETKREVALDNCKKILSYVEKNYDNIKARHISDYRSLYGRQTFSLNDDFPGTTSQLYKAAKSGDVKTELCELLYNYGKFLMISGSRSGGQALNLQGIWNNSVRPPWSGNYTANINTEMNHWGMTKSNLADCAEPYIKLIYGIMKNGRETAEINYGCKGFCCNHNVDIWCKTTPVKGDASYMYAPLCGAWLSNELYSHYKTGGLEKYRDEIFEIVSQAAEFVNDYLVLHDGFYVTAPSASPEIKLIRNGVQAGLDYASTFEMCIAKQAFLNYLEIADDELANEIKQKLLRLYPIKGRDIGINEWHDDYPVKDKGHRHFSPLYGFYPADILKYHENPIETEWVRKLFSYRLDNSKRYIGWSAAWAICICGRLHNGKRAKQIIDSMLSHAVFKNLFSIHPPFLFQIDGNLGFVAGVNELLLYEENGVIDLLPALPENWKNGEVKNMVVNGTQVSFKWRNLLVTEVTSDKNITVSATNLDKNVSLGQNVIVD